MTTAPSGCGILYFAHGASYVAEAAFSARTFRRYSGIPVALVVSGIRPRLRRRLLADFDETIFVRHHEHPLKTKVRALLLTPYERTLFLDTDTAVCGPVGDIFDTLAARDLLLAHDVHADWDAPGFPLIAATDQRYYNTGVIGYRLSPAVRGLFAEWLARVTAEDDRRMRPGHCCDQQHFHRLLAEDGLVRHGVQLETLDNRRYNVRGQLAAALSASGTISDARILHYRGIPGQPRADRHRRLMSRPLRLARHRLGRLSGMLRHLWHRPRPQGSERDAADLAGRDERSGRSGNPDTGQRDV